MARPLIIAWVAVLTLLGSGCGQGAGNTPSDPTGPTTPPEVSEGQTTARQTASSSEEELVCRSDVGVSSTTDYAPGSKGEKTTPVELARRDFSEKLEGDDKLVPGRGRGAGTVRVVRDERVVAVIEYRRAGGGWLGDSYEACSGF